MKNELHYSPESLQDLDGIWDYIVQELGNVIAAENTVNSILTTIQTVETHAEIGSPLSSVVRVDSDYRFLVSGHYVVFYRVVQTDIYIDRILYGKRDILHILFDDLPDSSL